MDAWPRLEMDAGSREGSEPRVLFFRRCQFSVTSERWKKPLEESVSSSTLSSWKVLLVETFISQ